MASRIQLRSPSIQDEAEFLKLASASQRLHSPWIEAPKTAEAYAGYLRTMARPENYGFLVCQRRDWKIAGVINVTNVVMGVFRSGYLGYYAFAGYEQQGLMRDGLLAVIRRAFGRQMGLHRLEANIQPGNTASIALVRSCGFQREGFSPKYLKIRGRWRDHERWAIVAD